MKKKFKKVTKRTLLNRINGYIERLEEGNKADPLFILKKLIEPEIA